MQTTCVRRFVLNKPFAAQRIVASCIVAVSGVGGSFPMLRETAEGCAQVSLSDHLFWN